ncbi:MAG: hypothetical protein A2Y38_15465 [Spirochaetes bacterium GWB1_59_5]|nr:MAG: hypothetical protein A2Y38_15465 [Spirochaetes bacterium GWB1_59_5]
MLDIEIFSEWCWYGDRPRIWNRRTGRGILYRGHSRVLDFTAPYPVKVVTTFSEGDYGTFGT